MTQQHNPATHPRDGHGTGRINKQHTAWCGGCVAWYRKTATSIGQFESVIKTTGWVKYKARWYCPACAAGLPQPHGNVKRREY